MARRFSPLDDEPSAPREHAPALHRGRHPKATVQPCSPDRRPAQRPALPQAQSETRKTRTNDRRPVAGSPRRPSLHPASRERYLHFRIHPWNRSWLPGALHRDPSYFRRHPRDYKAATHATESATWPNQPAYVPDSRRWQREVAHRPTPFAHRVWDPGYRNCQVTPICHPVWHLPSCQYRQTPSWSRALTAIEERMVSIVRTQNSGISLHRPATWTPPP